jgi:hypothetical protein
MSEPMRDDDDPRGVASPPDPHAEEDEGVGRSGSYAGESRDQTLCAECDDPIRPGNSLCRSCREEQLAKSLGRDGGPAARNNSPSTAGDTSDPVWQFDRVGFVAVAEELDLTALAYGKAAFRHREDLGTLPVSVDERESFATIDDIDGDPHEVLQGNWPPLDEIIQVDSEHGRQVFDAAVEKQQSADVDDPVFYREDGSAVADIESAADLRSSIVDDGDTPVWIVPGFLYELDEDDGEDGDQHPQTETVTKTMLSCQGECGRTIHVYQEARDGLDWWSCQECGYERAGPSTRSV